jgi:hypothetical protein
LNKSLHTIRKPLILLGLAFFIHFSFRESLLGPPIFERYIALLGSYYLGYFIMYNLSDLLWLWSYMLIIDVLNPTQSRETKFWIMGGPIAGVILEAGQGFGLLKGTYDLIDLIIFITFPLLYFKFRRSEKSL